MVTPTRTPAEVGIDIEKTLLGKGVSSGNEWYWWVFRLVVFASWIVIFWCGYQTWGRINRIELIVDQLFADKQLEKVQQVERAEAAQAVSNQQVIEQTRAITHDTEGGRHNQLGVGTPTDKNEPSYVITDKDGKLVSPEPLPPPINISASASPPDREAVQEEEPLPPLEYQFEQLRKRQTVPPGLLDTTFNKHTNTVFATAFFSPYGGCEDCWCKLIAESKSRVWIECYSFTSTKIADAIERRIVKQREDNDKSTTGYKKIDIRIMMDANSTDGRKNQYERMVQLGKTYNTTSLNIEARYDANHAIFHNKVGIIDGDTVVSGSFNLTPHAEESNAENLIVMQDTEFDEVKAGKNVGTPTIKKLGKNVQVYQEVYDLHWSHSIHGSKPR